MAALPRGVRLLLAMCALSPGHLAAERVYERGRGTAGLSAASAAAADGPEHYFGGRFCSTYEMQEFGAVFPGARRPSQLHFSSKDPCPEKNVLWLYPTEDHNGAFKVDPYVCYRLMYWHERACSVSVQRVDGPEAAMRAIEPYAEGSIIHLVLGGHGDGTSLSWGGDGAEHEGKLRVYQKDAHDFLAAAAQRLADTSTIFLDSSYSSTEHAMESLAHYVARIASSAKRETGGHPDFAVFGTVHAMSNEELLIHEGTEAGLRAGFANIHGMREYRPMDAPKKPLAPGDWVRAYRKKTWFGNQGSRTRAGFVGEVSGEAVSIDFCDGTSHSGIPQAWVTQHAPLGSEVEAQILEKGTPLTRARLLGKEAVTPGEEGGDVLQARVEAGDGGAEVAVPCSSVRPIDLKVGGIEGAEYPSVGDWVRVEVWGSPASFAGTVTKRTMHGAMVKLGDAGRSWLGDKLKRNKEEAGERTAADPIEFQASALKVLAKAGASMVGKAEDGALWRGTFLGGAATDRGVPVHPDGTPDGEERLFPLDSVVSVRSGDSDVFRSSVAGCGCSRQTEAELRKQKLKGCSSSFCCAREGQELCKVEYPAACHPIGDWLQPCLSHTER